MLQGVTAFHCFLLSWGFKITEHKNSSTQINVTSWCSCYLSECGCISRDLFTLSLNLAVFVYYNSGIMYRYNFRNPTEFSIFFQLDTSTRILKLTPPHPFLIPLISMVISASKPHLNPAAVQSPSLSLSSPLLIISPPSTVFSCPRSCCHVISSSSFSHLILLPKCQCRFRCHSLVTHL